MLLAISILLGIDYIINLGNGDIQILPTSALIIVLWTICFPLAIILIVISCIVVLVKLSQS